MTEIHYVVGDATAPVGEHPCVIAHVCNDRGVWGAGFSGAVTRRWRQPEQDYRRWYRDTAVTRSTSPTAFGLGRTWFTAVGEDAWVASMVAQHGTRGPDNPKPIRYEALNDCLAELGRFALAEGAGVHMPRIGCGLAGGTWDQVEPLVRDALGARGIPVTVYDLP